LIGGGIKVLYDVLLLAQFESQRPEEELSVADAPTAEG
jgi:hypothetical protein